MTDGTVATMLVLPDGSELAFQDYFVRHQHGVAVADVRFATNGARATDAALAAMATAGAVVIAPSNPLVSIGPLRALAGVDAVLASRRDSVVAVSPIVGGHAIKGPAERLLVELGHEASVVGVARLYAPIAAALVIDPVDADHAAAVERAGMRAVVTPSVMSTPDVAAALARATIDARPVTGRAVSAAARRRRRAPSTAPSRGGCGPAPATRRSAPARPGGRRRTTAAASRATSGGEVAERRLHAGADVDHQPAPRWRARTSASTTSSTNTKSRVWRPSPVSRAGSPRVAAAMKAATTPAPARCRLPYTDAWPGR